MAMKKARLLLPLLLLPVIPTTGQVEHAPTPEQCRADADTWGIPKWGVLVPNENEFANFPNVLRHDRAVTAKMLDARSAEFTECMKTDNLQSGRYAQASRAYAIAEMTRMADFMQRHNNLRGQFYQEDDQGLR